MGRNRRQSKISEVVLRYEVDSGSVSEADRAAQEVLDGFKALEQQAAAARAEAAKYATEIDDVAIVERALQAAIKNQERTLQRNIQAMLEGKKVADDYGDSYRRASDDVESFGDVATNISQISGLTRTVGLGVVADIGLVGADIADAVEGLRRIGPAAADAGQKALEAINGFTGLDLSMAQLGIAAGAAGIAVGAIILALEAFKAANEEAVQAVQTWIAGTQEANQLLRGGITTEDSVAQIDAWNQEIADNTERIALLRGSYEQITNGTGVLTTAMDALNVQGIQEMRNEFEELEARNLELNVAIGELRNERGQEIIATNDLAEREKELTAARSDGRAELEALIEQEQQAARDQIAAMQEVIDAQRERAEYESELADLVADTSQRDALKSASESTISGLRDAFTDFVDDAESKIGDAQDALRAKEQALTQAYYKESLDALESYQTEVQQSEEDTQRERLRILQDLQSELLSAEEANDVVAFIRAQRAGATQLTRFDEDASVDARRRSQEFQTEQKQRADQFQTRLADERNAAQERINAIRESIDERRDLLQQQIEEERAALVIRLQLQQQALEEELAMRKQAYAQQLADQAAYNAQQAGLQRKLADSLAAATASARSQYNTTTTTAATSSSFLSRLAGTATSALTSSPATINISTGNIGSNLSRSEVTSSLSVLAQKILTAQKNALATAKG